MLQASRHDDSSAHTSRSSVFGARSSLSRVSSIDEMFGVISTATFLKDAGAAKGTCAVLWELYVKGLVL